MGMQIKFVLLAFPLYISPSIKSGSDAHTIKTHNSELQDQEEAGHTYVTNE